MADAPALPHKTVSMEVADYLLSSNSEFIQNASKLALSGENDENLAIQFNTFFQRMAEFGSQRYFFAGATAGQFLDLIGDSALACANMFRMLGIDGSPVEIEWDGVKRTVPATRHIDLQNSIKVEGGLKYALLSGQSDELTFLAGLDERHHTHEQIVQTPFALAFTKYLQCLYGGDDEAASELQRALKDRIEDGSDPDSRSYWARCRAFLAVPDRNPEQLTGLIEDLLAKHKKLFDSGRNNMRNRVLGFVALDAMAVIVLARQRGVLVDIENAYLPKDLLQAAIERSAAIENAPAPNRPVVPATWEVPLEIYLASYLEAEEALRQMHGEFAYFSKPVVYERGDQLVPVTPWGEYTGDPLILPHPDQVAHVAISAVGDDGQIETFVRSLKDLVSVLAKAYAVNEVEQPVRHLTVRIPFDTDDRDSLRQSVLQLPEVSI